MSLSEAILAYNERRYDDAYTLFYPEAAYRNDAEAQYYLGMMHHDGDGADRDLSEAKKWWKKAMRQKHREAAYALSELETSTKNSF